MAIEMDDQTNSEGRLSTIQLTLAELEEETKVLTARWHREKDLISSIKDLAVSKENLRKEMEASERNSNLQRLSELKYAEMPSLEVNLSLKEAELRSFQAESKILREEVSEEDIAEVVSRWTGIPVTKMLQKEMQKLEIGRAHV